MTEKNWEVCAYCLKKNLCKVGQERTKGLVYNSPTLTEIGCFNYEIYKAQEQSKQMKIF